MTLVLDGSMKACKEKAFFAELDIFCHDCCEGKLTKKSGEGEMGLDPKITGGMKVALHYDQVPNFQTKELFQIC